MCMFCPYPSFYSLNGELLLHFDRAHPHEVPVFVKNLIVELGLEYEPEGHSKGRVYPSFLMRDYVEWPELTYRDDGISTQLRLSPWPKVSEYLVKLSEISEHLLVPWYYRDINDYGKYRHRNVKYNTCPFFDPKNSETQIIRVKIGFNGQEMSESKQYMCIYCRCPLFHDALPELGIPGHIAGHHR